MAGETTKDKDRFFKWAGIPWGIVIFQVSGFRERNDADLIDLNYTYFTDHFCLWNGCAYAPYFMRKQW